MQEAVGRSVTLDGRPASRWALGAVAADPGECVGVVREGAAAMVDIPVGYRLGPDVRLEQEPVSSDGPVVEGLEGYAGSSTGLALALAYLRVLTGVAHQAPIRIGATGVLEPGSTAGVWRVSSVGSAAVSALGCRTRVIAVDTLDDAVQWLAYASR